MTWLFDSLRPALKLEGCADAHTAHAVDSRRPLHERIPGPTKVYFFSFKQSLHSENLCQNQVDQIL